MHQWEFCRDFHISRRVTLVVVGQGFAMTDDTFTPHSPAFLLTRLWGFWSVIWLCIGRFCHFGRAHHLMTSHSILVPTDACGKS